MSMSDKQATCLGQYKGGIGCFQRLMMCGKHNILYGKNIDMGMKTNENFDRQTDRQTDREMRILI